MEINKIQQSPNSPEKGSTGHSVLSFYVFTKLTACQELQQQIRFLAKQLNLKGTVILAAEGLNGSLAGLVGEVEKFAAYLQQNWGNKELKFTCTATDSVPFKKLMIKIKPEIVTLHQGQVPAEQKTGKLVEPELWHKLLDDKQITVIDVRNRYETSLGKFPEAIDPETDNFGQFPDFASGLDKKKKIAMYCTGGIRCEKASSYLLEQGFKEIYQLKGGILNYLQKIPREKQRWCGKCFVFDQRQKIDQTTCFVDLENKEINQK